MPRSGSPTRQRIVNSARELFVRQGITQTTTRQIAETAGVNEVTLFRHFGTKQGLLLAVFADLGVFEGVQDLLQPSQTPDWPTELYTYVESCFQALAHNPELVRSVVGEAGLYSEAHRHALQGGFLSAQEQLTDYLTEISGGASDSQKLSQAAAMLHIVILGLAVLQVTAELPATGMGQSQEAISQQWLQACFRYWLEGLPELVDTRQDSQ